MTTLHKERYEQLVVDVLTKGGLSQEQAEAAAEVMGYADQRGIESHGLILLKTYIERIKQKIIVGNPAYKWDLHLPNVAVLDGASGMGHFMGKIAMEEAIKKAKEHTIGLVFVKNTSHYGASGYYTELAAKHGMIGFSTTNTFPLMAPTGGAERVLGNNPISFSVPRENENPIILDIATSVVAAGKLLVAESKNETIPEGWAIDKNGQPTTDPHAGYLGGGSLLPMASHKGYGLALVMDVLAGVLAGSGYGTKVGHSTIGYVMMAINVNHIMPEQEFYARVEDLTGMVQSSRKAVGTEKIYLPGELEYVKQADREENGFKLSEKLYAEIEYLAEELGLDVAQYFR